MWIVPFQPHADVDRDDVTLFDHSLFRRNAVHDLLIDRRADARREIVKALERGRRTWMRSNEIVGDLVQIHRRHARTHAPLKEMHRLREDLAATRHDLNLT